MLEPHGIGVLFMILFFTHCYALTPCDNPSVCFGNENDTATCFRRPSLYGEDGADFIDYVCDCSISENIGYNCNVTNFPIFHTEFRTCYGVNCTTGYFESINYPAHYSNQWSAIYQLFIPGASSIDFRFEGSGGFGVEALKDGFYVGTGLSFSWADISNRTDITTADRQVRYFDDNKLDGDTYPDAFSLNSDTVWMYFITDNVISYSGWRLGWSAVVRGCSDPTVCFGNTIDDISVPCYNRQLNYYSPDTVDYVCDCSESENIGHSCSIYAPISREFHTCYGVNCAEGFFESHNYPEPYPNRWSATYLLFIPGASKIFFQFEGSGGFGIESIKDELHIGTGLSFSYEDLREENLITDEIEVRFFDNRTLNGKRYPDSFSLNTDVVWIYFSSDKTVVQNGWRLAWSADVIITNDTILPVINGCPNDIVMQVYDYNAPAVSVTWQPPTATTESDKPIRVEESHSPGTEFAPGSMTTVTYTFSDSIGINAVCKFDVIIKVIGSWIQ